LIESVFETQVIALPLPFIYSLLEFVTHNSGQYMLKTTIVGLLTRSSLQSINQSIFISGTEPIEQ